MHHDWNNAQGIASSKYHFLGRMRHAGMNRTMDLSHEVHKL